MPIAFALIIGVSILDRSERAEAEREGFEDQYVRAQTGYGAAAASNH